MTTRITFILLIALGSYLVSEPCWAQMQTRITSSVSSMRPTRMPKPKTFALPKGPMVSVKNIKLRSQYKAPPVPYTYVKPKKYVYDVKSGALVEHTPGKLLPTQVSLMRKNDVKKHGIGMQLRSKRGLASVVEKFKPRQYSRRSMDSIKK